MFRQGLPRNLDDLLALDFASLGDALAESARAGIIPSLSASELEQILAALRALKAERALHATNETRPSSLGDLLGAAARLDAARQRTVAELSVEHQGLTNDLWRALDERTDFTREDVAAIRAAVQLGELTQYHLPLVLELQRETATGSEPSQKRGARSKRMAEQHCDTDAPAVFPDVRSFAGLEADDWKAILTRPQENGQPVGVPAGTPGATDEERLQNYATSLSNRVEAAVPTAAIAARLANDTAAGNPFSTESADLQTFFENNPDFDFKTGPWIFTFRTIATRSSKASPTRGAVAKLASMERVFNVAPKYRDMRTILADDSIPRPRWSAWVPGPLRAGIPSVRRRGARAMKSSGPRS